MVDSPGRITLWGIEVFMAAADERSISAAARRLGASPAAVSQQLTNLEAAMGATRVDLWGVTGKPPNAHWAFKIDADGFYDLLIFMIAQL